MSNVTNEFKKAKIEKLRLHESQFSSEITNIDKQIRDLTKRRNKLRRSVSKAMLYINKLINEVYSDNLHK